MLTRLRSQKHTADDSSVSDFDLFAQPRQSVDIVEQSDAVTFETNAAAAQQAPEPTNSSDEDSASSSELQFETAATRRPLRKRAASPPVTRQTKQRRTTTTPARTRRAVTFEEPIESAVDLSQMGNSGSSTSTGQSQTAAVSAQTNSTARPMQTGSVPDIVDTQQTRRSSAREALAALRRNRIPGYAADVADVERDVVIEPAQFRSLREDSAFEYQDANKPPWAQRVPREMIDKVRTWELQEVLSELDARKHDWYRLATTVAGKLQVSTDALIVLGPQSASASAVQPTRAQRSANLPIAGTQSSLGASNISRDLASLVGITPLRQDAFGGADAPTQTTDLSRQFELFRQGQQQQQQQAPPVGGSTLLPPLTPSRPPTVQRPSDTATLDDLLAQLDTPQQTAATDGSLDETLLLQTQIALDTQGNLPQSGARTTLPSQARYRALREARREKPAYYERDNSEQSRIISQTVRAEGARGRSWISRPLATGVFFLNPNYVSARDGAYSLIVGRADQLAGVEMRFFARQARSGTVQFLVRDQFAKLIAQEYRLATHGRSGSSKLASDARNFADSAEAIVQFFVNRIDWDAKRKQFTDTGAQAALNQRPVWTRASYQTPTLSTFTPNAEANPLLVNFSNPFDSYCRRR